MARKAVDAAATELVATLLEGIAKIAEEQVKARTDELAAEILAKLPEVVALPPPPADVPQERLLRPSEAAELPNTMCRQAFSDALRLSVLP